MSDIIPTLVTILAMVILLALYFVVERQNRKLNNELDNKIDELLSARLEIMGYQAVVRLDGAMIDQMYTHIDSLETKLAAANTENAELRKRTLAYDAETDTAVPEVQPFDDHVDDALAIAAQASGGDFIADPEPEDSGKPAFMTEDQIEQMLHLVGNTLGEDPSIGMIEGTFDAAGKPVITATHPRQDNVPLASVVPFKKKGY